MTTTGPEPTTAEEQYAKAVAQMEALGLRVPSRDAWKKTRGIQKTPEQIAASIEAERLGAEWRKAVNQRSIQEAVALGWAPAVLGPSPPEADGYTEVYIADETLVSDREEDLEVLKKLREAGARIPPKYAYLNNFGRAANDPDYDEASRVATAWRDDANRKSLEASYAVDS